MIDIPPPTALQSRSISTLTFRQRGRTLLERGIRSPNQRQRQAKTDSCSGHRPATQSPNPAQARSTFASRPRRRQTAILKSP
jgi:hypothetical protein